MKDSDVAAQDAVKFDETNMSWHLPPYTIESAGSVRSLAETIPEYVKRLGQDFRAVKKASGNGTMKDGSPIKIGVVDTGASSEHLSGDLGNLKERVDFTRSRNGANDVNDHGSWCLGAIGADDDNDGIEGVASDCELYSAKALGDDGAGSVQGIAQAIDWCVSKGCRIVSLSLGGGFSATIDAACRRATQAGVIVVAAMGNSPRQPGHPGLSDHTLGVTAIDLSDRIAVFSSRSLKAIFTDYGVNVLSLLARGRWGRLSGTSMSTPVVAGKLALALGYLDRAGYLTGDPVRDHDIVIDACVKTVDDMGRRGHDEEFGYGKISMDKLMEEFPSRNPDSDNPTNPDNPDNPVGEEPKADIVTIENVKVNGVEGSLRFVPKV